MPWIIRVFFPMLVFWLWGTLLICGIYGRGVGGESHNASSHTEKIPTVLSLIHIYFKLIFTLIIQQF
jgi:hypothetical protein